MSWFQSIVYGFIGGLTNFIPASAQAHESFMQILFGSEEQPMLQILVHFGALLALLFAVRPHLSRLRREQRLLHISKHRRKRTPDFQSRMELKLLKTAGVLVSVSFILYPFTLKFKSNLAFLALFLFMNGVIIFLPRFRPQGNKDSRMMTPLDGVLIGTAGALGIFPGISRMGGILAMLKVRGADREFALQTSLLLLIPAFVLLILFDFYFLIASGFAGVTFISILKSLLASLASFAGATGGIGAMRFLAVKTGFGSFSYYSWGLALISFILFLTAS